MKFGIQQEEMGTGQTAFRQSGGILNALRDLWISLGMLVIVQLEL